MDPGTRLFIRLPLLFASAGAAAASFFITFGVANLNRRPVLVLAGLTAAGLGFGFVCALHHRFMRVGPVKEMGE